MTWTETAILWHCYPLRFVAAEPTAVPEVHHRLPRLVPWLDYVLELGANGLLLAPIFASVSHGYDTLDHFRIDPRLGDESDFHALVVAARARGVRIVLDGVFNHVSREHPLARAALAGGPHSEAGRMVKWSGEHVGVWEGHDALVELDLTRPPVADLVVDVMTHWLDRGADGWRLDAAYSPGAAVWAPLLERVRARHPEAFFLAEMIQGPYEDFVAASTVDSVTQYEFWFAVGNSIADRNLFELDHMLGRHAHLLETFVPQTFLSNHDVSRVATRITDERHRGHAIALLALTPGIPSIYAGDEQGFTGEKTDREHGDDAVRPPFPETPAGLLPFGWETYRRYQRLLGLRRRHPWLTRASVATREVENEYAIVRYWRGGDALDLALNLSDRPRPLPPGTVLEASEADAHEVPAHGWTVTRP